ncbi:MAG: TolC family protein [Cyclobacteriaceae bacterium]
MIRRISWILLVFLASTNLIKAQNLPALNYKKAYEVPDSAVFFTINDFFQIVLGNHPVIKQANIQTEKARQILRSARGQFDPKLEAQWDVKEFEGKDYYNTLNAGLKVPVWVPIDLKAGLDQNTGLFLNPERSIPDANENRQLFLGLAIPIGKGLFIDERRATVKQAMVFQSIAEAEQTKMVNKIIFQATKDYYNWYNAYFYLRFLEQSIQIANQIFSRVLIDFEFGEAAAIDTVQAQITIQNRQIELHQAKIDYTNASLMLSNHLWTPNELPLELTENSLPPRLTDVPQTVDESLYVDLVKMAEENHPEIVKLQGKIEQLNVQRSLARENLKPQLDLSYTFIDEPINSLGESSAFQLDENYKLGLDFSIPIFLRKERGKLKETNLKIRESEYDVQLTTRNLINGITAVFQELNQLTLMIAQLNAVVNNYERMVQAELFNLQNGESDLFKINFQQEKLISAQLKYLKIRTYYEKMLAELYYTAGLAISDNQ